MTDSDPKASHIRKQRPFQRGKTTWTSKKSLRWVLLSLVLLLAAFFAAMRVLLSPELYRRKAIEKLSNYLNVPVEVEEARFHPTGGISMAKVKVFSSPEKSRILFQAEKVSLKHRSASLLRNRFEIREAELLNPILFVDFVQGPGGTTSDVREILQAIRKPGAKMEKIPTLRVRNGKVVLRYHPMSGRARQSSVEKIDLSLGPDKERAGNFSIAGSIRDEELGNWDVRGRYDPKSQFLQFRAKSGLLNMGKTLREYLPQAGRKIWDSFNPAGKATVEAFFQYDGSSPEPVGFKICVHLQDAQMAYAKFPYRLTSINGDLEFDQKGVRFENLRASAGDLNVVGRGEFFGYGKGAGMDLTISAENLPIDSKLRDAFAPSHRSGWEQLNPSGVADATIRLRRKKGRKHINIEVDAKIRSGRLAFRDFPYDLSNIEGSFHYRDGSLFIDGLTSKVGSSRVSILGQIREFGLHPGVDLLIEAKGIPLDDKIAALLPEGVQGLWRECGIGGKVDLVARLFRKAGEGNSYGWDARVNLSQGRICYTGFPYEVKGLEGTLSLRRDGIEIDGLTSQTPDRSIFLSGKLEEAGREPLINLHIVASNIPLDEDLERALPLSVQKWWRALSPEGKISIICDLTRSGENPPQIDLRLELLSASILYERFPYSISDIRGEVRYSSGVITLQNLRGRHGKTFLTCSGHLFTGEPSGDIQFRVGVQDLLLDEELRGVLPEGLRRLWDTFSPEGKVHFDTRVITRTTPAGKKRVDFQTDLRFDRVSLHSGVRIGEALGKASLEGFKEGESYAFQGQTRLKSVKITGKQLTDLSALFSKEGDSIGFHNVSATIYGGLLKGSAKVTLSAPVIFGAQAQIKDMGLRPLSKEVFGYENPGITGKVSGVIHLQAGPARSEGLAADGELYVREAKLWELPVVLAMLKLLNLSLPERTAFQEADLKYYISDDQVVVPEIALRGKALSIYGHGRMGLEGSLNFDFVAGLGPQLPYLPFVTGIIHNLQRQVAELRVGGTFAKPDVRLEPRGIFSLAAEIFKEFLQGKRGSPITGQER